MTKYLEIKTSDDAAKKNEWFAQCREKNIPYVIVSLSGSTASVQWDYITYPMESEEIFSKNEADLKAELMNIYGRYSTKDSEFSISTSTANFSGLSIDHARATANEIFDFIDKLIKNNR